MAVADQLANLPIRISAGTSVEWDRFANASSANWDKVRPFLRLQYVDATNDQAFSPYFAYVTRMDFDPTLASRFATRQDLNLGVNKVFNFDGNFARVPFPGNSAAPAVGRIGLTAGVHQYAGIAAAAHHAGVAGVAPIRNAIEIEYGAHRLVLRLAAPDREVPVNIKVFVAADARNVLALATGETNDFVERRDRVAVSEALPHLSIASRAARRG